MRLSKVVRDNLVKTLSGTTSSPPGLFELHQYFRQYKNINFKKYKEGGQIIAVSEDFRFGKIVTSGSDEEQLDRQIKDAILTAFEIPSSYGKEAGVVRVGEKKDSYALA